MASEITLPSDKTAIRALGRMPFLERRELSAVAPLAERTALNALHRLESAGLAFSVKHSLNERARMKRWYLTARGIVRFSEIEDMETRDALRRFPLSAEWRRSLLRRMATVAACYRIALDTCAPSQGILAWRWERSGPLDAVMTLPDRRTLGIARFGSALSKRGMYSRLGSLAEMNRRNHLFAALVVVPGPIEAHGVLEWMRGKALNLSVCEEGQVRNGAPGDAIWRSHVYRPDISFPLRAVIRSVLKRSLPPASSTGRRASMPRDDAVRLGGHDLVSCDLVEPAATMLGLLTDWPLMRQSDISRFLGISPGRIRAGAAQLRRLGLVVALRNGSTGEQRSEKRTQLALSRDGLRHLAWRDRTRLSDLKKFWSVSADPGGATDLNAPDLKVTGTKLRVLARELNHTSGVHRFISCLAACCRSSRDWELVQALPPHRWERWFRHSNRRYGIRPDATVRLAWRGHSLSLLLEYEERAVKPVRMRERLSRYRSYFGALETQRDFDGRSVVAVVFPDRATASRFAAFASREISKTKRSAKGIPLLVGNAEAFDAQGVLTRCWMIPSNLSLGLVRPETLLSDGSRHRRAYMKDGLSRGRTGSDAETACE